MRARPRGIRASRRGPSTAGRTAQETVEAARRLHGLGHDAPIVLLVHPTADLNPFQPMLYREAWSCGFGPVVLHDLADLEALPSPTDLGARVVLHLHWTTRILKRAADADEARRAIDTAVGRLDSFRGAGGHLIWTVHNVIPHDARRPDAEAELQRAIVDRALVIHVMSPSTLEAAAAAFPIPAERALSVPHPSYAGAYPDLIGRDEARHRAGLDPDAVVYAMLGAIRPYKGLDTVIDAFDRLLATDPPGTRPRHLLVAGIPDATAVTDEFVRRATRHPFITIDPRRLPPDDLIGYLRAADVALLAHARALNSGFLLLAITEGLPVILPDLPAFDDLASPAFARRFASGDAAALADAMRDADALLTPDGLAGARAAERTIAEARDPRTISRQFLEGVRAALERAERHPDETLPPGPA